LLGGRGRPASAHNAGRRAGTTRGAPGGALAAPAQTRATGANILGIRLAAPVVYCIDGGGSMGEGFDLARLAVLQSLANLSPQDRFNVIIWREGEPGKLAPGWLDGGPAGLVKAREFLDAAVPAGAANAGAGLDAAIALAPRSIVILTGKAPAGLEAVAAACKEKGIAIIALPVGGYSPVEQALARLAAQTGGTMRKLTHDDAKTLAEPEE